MQLAPHGGRPPFTSTELMVEFVVVLIVVYELLSLCACDSGCVAVDDGLVVITMRFYNQCCTSTPLCETLFSPASPAQPAQPAQPSQARCLHLNLFLRKT